MNLLNTITIKLREMIMLKKILFVVIAGCLAIQCDNLKPEDSNRGTTAGLDNNFLLPMVFSLLPPT